MLEQENIIDHALRLTLSGELGRALATMRNALAEYAYLPGVERLSQIEDDYRLMLDYMRRGFRDEKREELFRRLLRQMFRLAADMEVEWCKRNTALYAEAVQVVNGLNMSPDFLRSVLEGYVTDMAMLSLENDIVKENSSRDLHSRHQQFVNRLFCVLLTSGQWSDADRAFYEELLLLPTVDVNDVLLMVSAISLAVFQQTDVNKILTLTTVYEQAADERVRQRSLTGWALALPEEDITFFPELSARIKQLCSEASVRRELLELQIQMFYCMNAEKDHREIQRDIMPTLLKHNNLNVTRFGIEEKEDDPMQDILHPDAADKAMEEVEEGIRKMMAMQKAGSDIYFGGFSQMKHFPFFSSLSNWLMPFYVDHPGLQQVMQKMKGNRFLELLFEVGPFCDSDKYSFALAMSNIVDRMPPSVRELMNTEEALSPMPTDDQRSPAYIRRMYLQDLYRLNKVHPRRSDLNDPFKLFFGTELMALDSLADTKLELGKFLMKQGRWEDVANLLSSFGETVPEQSDFDFLSAYTDMHDENYFMAAASFEKILKQQPDSERALKGYARCCLMNGEYEHAADAYGKLLNMHPASKSYALNRSVSLLKLNKAEEAVELLYRLNYEHPDDGNVKRALAWGLLCQNKLDAAQKEYKTLLAEEHPVAEDYLNAGYCNWFLNQTDRAASLFRSYLSADETYSLEHEFNKDWELLTQYGISRTEQQMMNDLVSIT